jgi:hypothetical protein
VKRIRIVIPYFGRWPEWLDFFLDSCRSNPSVDWVFFTDCGAPANAPDNVEFVKGTLDDFNQRASSALCLNVCAKSSYKLCDFKPALGHIFSDYLTGYDFWGSSDIDLIYGDIRRFATDDILSNHDIVSCTDQDGLVHYAMFALFRNSDAVNLLYEKSRDYRAAFEAEEYWRLDEWHQFDSKTQKMGQIVRREQEQQRLRVYLDMPCRNDLDMTKAKRLLARWFPAIGRPVRKRVRWSDGKLTQDGEEIVHYHFLRTKNPNRVVRG